MKCKPWFSGRPNIERLGIFSHMPLFLVKESVLYFLLLFIHIPGFLLLYLLVFVLQNNVILFNFILTLISRALCIQSKAVGVILIKITGGLITKCD